MVVVIGGNCARFTYRKYGLKEEYADTLVLCRYCRCLFWKSFGHPCVQCPDGSGSEEQKITSEHNEGSNPAEANQAIDEGGEQAQAKTVAPSVPLHIPVPPQAFLKFFSL